MANITQWFSINSVKIR